MQLIFILPSGTECKEPSELQKLQNTTGVNLSVVKEALICHLVWKHLPNLPNFRSYRDLDCKTQVKEADTFTAQYSVVS